MHAKYEVSASNGSKVIANVKVDNRQTDRQTNRQTNKQTGQKQYAPDHSIRGHKKSTLIKLQSCKIPLESSTIQLNNKREVPRDVRNSKVRRQDKFRRDWSRHKNTFKSQRGTGPGFRRSKRPLLACHTRCIFSMETLLYYSIRELPNSIR